ncbi:MAG: hypothetical protein QM756_20995 [Polyangiaceae bacterium]
MTSDDSRQRAADANVDPGEPARETEALPPLRPSCWCVALPETPFALPAACACCGAPASEQVGIGAGTRRLLVGYCHACSLHLARDSTERLAARLSSAIVGLSACFALPVFSPWSSVFVCSTLVVLLSAVPQARLLFPKRSAAPHVASGPAVWLRSAGELVCRRRDYAEEAAVRAGSLAKPIAAPRKLSRFELGALALLALVLTPLSHAYQHPPVRVLNLGDATSELRVDGKRLGGVEPSSGESPFAGVELNLPAGERVLELYDLEGRPLDMAHVQVRAGEHHLFVPGAPDTCFWLETRGYGRGARRVSYEPLLGSQRFWVIPEDVHGWFLPASEAGSDARVTGGSARVLRQARCEDAPLPR